VPPARREEPHRLKRLPLVAALAGAAAVAAVLIAVSLLGTSAGQAEPRVPQQVSATPAQRDALFRGIPQNGIALGNPHAPVTLVEYADLQCPYCAQWARDSFPTIVEEYVRDGRVRVVFRGLAFIGADSDTALRAALAAGQQDRLWDVVHGLFVQQGAENSGWVSDAVLRSFDGTGLDTQRMLDSTHSPEVERQLAAAQSAATAAGVSGTPFFQAGQTGAALVNLEVGSLDPEAFRRELDQLLAK
jgi:protein-disulfide isomerase